MCGIVGFFDPHSGTRLEDLERMTTSLWHRGPDEGGQSIFYLPQGQWGVGHRRLSIIDLSPGASQPMFSEDKRFVIVFNGEVYNFQSIRSELEGLGVRFRSQSDTEVVLQAFIRWGKSAVQKFRGMFAFGIVDTLVGKITCCRDRAGVKPFYYYWKDGLFLFGSEVRSFYHHPRFHKTLNPSAVSRFLQFQYVPSPLSIFSHTWKLPPGHFLEFDCRSRALVVQPYWEVLAFYTKPKLNISAENAEIELEKILLDSCRLRMIADVPVGVFLSGGYDSTLVACLLQKGASVPLKTFTIGFSEGVFNEAEFARKIAEHLGTDHHELICTPSDALGIIPKLPEIYDEPFADASAIPTFLVSKFARQFVKVALSADGGDEAFAGYRHYARCLSLRGWLALIPDVIRHIAGRCLAKFGGIGYKSHGSGFHGLASQLIKTGVLLQGRGRPMDILLTIIRLFEPLELDSLLLLGSHVGDDLFALRETSRELAWSGDLDQMLGLAYLLYLPDDMLVKVDRATMANGLEGREPLLDHEVIEFAARLPDQFKIGPDGTQKALLKKVLHRNLPGELVNRPKMGFGLPLEKWMKGELRDLVFSILSPGSLKRGGIFCPHTVDRLLQSFYHNSSQSQERGLFYRIWSILVFEMWRKKWLEA